MRVLHELPGVQRALGCSEPGAIALAAASAARAVGGRVQAIEILCDAHTLKNSLGAGIPGAKGHGPNLAGALGAIGGDPTLALEVLASVEAADLAEAEALLEAGGVSHALCDPTQGGGIFVEVRVRTELGLGSTRIEGSHSRIIAVAVDGVSRTVELSTSEEGDHETSCWDTIDLSGVWELADGLDEEDRGILLGGLEANLAAARAGLGQEPVGSLEPGLRAELYAAAAANHRMLGSSLPVQTSGFSGNQGLVATLPVWAQAEALGASRDELAEALALSHLVGRYVRTRTGVVSLLCNAVQGASAGAAAACVRLRGGDLDGVRRAIELTLASVAGTVCDGAKPGCSLKVGLGASRALRSAEMALAGLSPTVRDGLVGADLEETLANLGSLAAGLGQAEAELLRIVLEKQRPRRLPDAPRS